MLMQPHPSPLLPARAFTFLRHGETDWNVLGKIQGQTDTELNAKGLAQAHAAAAKLASTPDITLVISSPLKRAWRTAHVVANALGTALVIEPNLKERGFGSFEGRLRSEIEQEQNLDPGTSMTHMTYPPDAETWEALQQRALKVVQEWLSNCPAGHQLLFVSHGAFFRALHSALDIPHTSPVHNAHPFRFTPTSQGWSLTE